jgi:hypothetical protein
MSPGPSPGKPLRRPAARLRRSVLVIRLIGSQRLAPQLCMAFDLWPGIDYPFFRTM